MLAAWAVTNEIRSLMGKMDEVIAALLGQMKPPAIDPVASSIPVAPIKPEGSAFLRKGGGRPPVRKDPTPSNQLNCAQTVRTVSTDIPGVSTEAEDEENRKNGA